MPVLKKCETLKRTHLFRVTRPSSAKVAAQLFIQIKEEVFIIYGAELSALFLLFFYILADTSLI